MRKTHGPLILQMWMAGGSHPLLRPGPHMAGLWLDVTSQIVSTLVCFERADYQSDSWCWGQLAPTQGLVLLHLCSCLAQGPKLNAGGSLWVF